MQRRIKKSLAQFPYLLKALGFVWKAAGGWTIAWVMLLIIQGVLPVASVYLTRTLVDRLVSAIGAGFSWESARLVILPLALIAAVMLMIALLNSLSNWIRTAQSERVQDYMSQVIHKKSYSVDLAFYDSPDFYDHLHRARSDATYRPVALLEGIGSLIQNGVTMVSMAVLLIQFGWWMPLVLVASTIPAFLVVLNYRERLYHWRLKTTPTERKTWYYEWLLTDRETAPELRLFQLGDLFSRRFQELRRGLREERTGLARDQAVAELVASTLSLIITGFSMIWMLIQAINGRFSLGDVAFFYQAFIQGQSLARSFLENVGEIYSNSLFLSDLFEFLNLEPQIKDPAEAQTLPETFDRGVEFENVTFTYPDSEREVLRQFNLKLTGGQFAAIVGPNGAGKSTLVRLLCRFYDPQDGSIRLEDVDLKQIRLEDLRRSITVLFQQPVQYNATASENISLGDLHLQATEEQIQAAAEAAGAAEPILRLPQGYATLLGKWFEGGADLSVGEWQRLALARAFLRQARLVILDEPTSAMDPWAEAEWLARLRAVTTGKIVILITHRITTAAQADVIHVMQDGKIIESGSHEALLATGGMYAQSWYTQLQHHS